MVKFYLKQDRVTVELQYKGFIARLCFSPEAGTFYGEVINARDLISFQVEDLQEAKQVMRQAIDNYLKYLAAEEYETR